MVGFTGLNFATRNNVPSSLHFAPRSIRSFGGKGLTLPLVHPIMLPACWTLPPRPAGFGGKGIRTPDFQLAKLALYQLSYAPAFRIAECRLAIADFNPEKLSGLSSCFPYWIYRHSPRPSLVSTRTTSYFSIIGISFCSSSSFQSLPS